MDAAWRRIVSIDAETNYMLGEQAHVLFAERERLVKQLTDIEDKDAIRLEHGLQFVISRIRDGDSEAAAHMATKLLSDVRRKTVLALAPAQPSILAKRPRGRPPKKA